MAEVINRVLFLSKFGAVEGQRGEVVVDGFGAANELHVAVLLQQEFRAAELAVVVEAHGMAVGAGVEDDEAVANLDFR